MRVLHAADLPERVAARRRPPDRGRQRRRPAAGCPAGAFDMVYVDPPFNTGRARRHERLRVVADADGDRGGFGGRRYRTESRGALQYDDAFDDYLGFLMPRLAEARRVLAAHGTLYVHLDPRESHYVKVALDGLFGRDCFLNEIVWAYDYGGRPRRRWPPKHDTILVYVRDPARYHFDDDEVDREPYMAPGPRDAREAARGKRPSDTGGTRSCRRTAPSAPATRRRSPRGSCGGWSPPRRARAGGAWTSSPGPGRSAPSRAASGGASSSSTRARTRSRWRRGGLGGYAGERARGARPRS